MTTWYNAHPGCHRLPKLFLKNVINSDWAELHGPAIKAASTRGAAPVFQYLAQTYFDGARELHECIKSVVNNLCELYKSLHEGPMFMNAAQVSRINDVCIAFGINYQKCREQGRLAGHLVFPVRTKVHKMQHLP